VSHLLVEPYPYGMDAGRLCLDFANTASALSDGQREERLISYGRLVSWARKAGVVGEEQAAALLAEAARRPEEAGAVLLRARALRDAIQTLFVDAAERRSADDAALATLNDALGETMGASRIVATPGGGFRWAPGEGGTLDRMLPPVVRSAADLLTSEELARVRACAAGDCLWLFLDTTRNRSRRWCDMKSCGNRMKVRRHRERRRVGR
jgi:predicted RNA-binding Zn ribbon-like protein